MTLPEEAQALFEKLRETRLTLAREQGVPPYVIFHDKTLAEMALMRPQNNGDLSLISGIGESKRAKYGAAFLAVIQEAAV